MKVHLLNLFNTPTKSTTASRLIASIDLSVNRVLTQSVRPDAYAIVLDLEILLT